MADRGLYARWLFEAIQSCHWHPYLRINRKVFFRPKTKRVQSLVSSLPARRMYLGRERHVFQDETAEVTLLVQWEEGYKEPSAGSHRSYA